MGKVVLTGKGRRWLAGGHPWVWADDVASGGGEPGELLPVEDPQGRTVGWGLYSVGSKIAVRLVTRAERQPDRAFWAALVARAVRVRERAGLLDPDGACRLVAGDADGLPGLVVDRYARVAVLQSGTQAADRMRDFLLELLRAALPFPLAAVVDRSDTGVRRLESLEPRVEVLDGALPAPLVVREGDLAYEVDVLRGHKTGHYLDQRDNRLRAAARAEGRSVLDAFSYDGLFGIRAALAGATRVVCLDQSREAGERALANAARNGVADRVEFQRCNAMSELRARALGPERFGLVVVDPPAFARSRREAAGAERGYVEVNRRAATLVEAGGHLVSASCSANVRPEAFLGFVASAVREAGREAFLEELTGAGLDHPVRIGLPETRYLKCAFLRVED